ncbi:cob(I)yrinic acid a,c-diamide adenosyltransferase [Paenibacillus urinalis]|uniref:Corrinoid adenosyltransferase n=1 Tax=Paenibacillus urinalis TaxID=521520 RepID=A0ABY7XGC1_9BACL|nr:cob(I)yrinic acid a,c-diamide adenosyltransferase [Paenibacillus urinalis]WDI04808.1 cob(I)yrinic acid a,c-diamide adenosyltransferase [Paenibacillus urinalis]
MKIYTKSGDKGKTSVIGARVPKDDDRIEAYGTIDELNCFVGQAISLAETDSKYEDLCKELRQIQQELFDCGSDLAFVKIEEGNYKVSAELAGQLEAWIDLHQEENPQIERFIIPGGSPFSSALHVCRTVCRRAERRMVTLGSHTDINPAVRLYMNRLSDYFFVIARTANVRAGIPDVEYIRSKKVFRSK